MDKDFMFDVKRCAEVLLSSRKVVLLSGAGMSTNAGIPDFRGPNGIYRKKMKTDPELIFDIDYFYQNPSFFYEFHREFLKTINEIQPTFSHYFFLTWKRVGCLRGLLHKTSMLCIKKQVRKKYLKFMAACGKASAPDAVKNMIIKLLSTRFLKKRSLFVISVKVLLSLMSFSLVKM